MNEIKNAKGKMKNDENVEEEVIEVKNPEIDYKDKYTRLLAEYSNFAKQKEVEMASMAKFANKGLISKILDILDDIEAGLIQSETSEETKSILSILKSKLEHTIEQY